METHIANLPDKDLAYFNEGTQHFGDYTEAALILYDAVPEFVTHYHSGRDIALFP